MTLRLAGSTSGYTEIDCPSVGGNNTLVLPTGNGSADQALVTNGSGTLSFADRGRMTLGQRLAPQQRLHFTLAHLAIQQLRLIFNTHKLQFFAELTP